MHAAYGHGYHFAIGGTPESPQAALEVYPQARLVFYRSERTHLALFNQDPPSFTPTGVVFEAQAETEQRAFVVTDQGEGTLYLNPGSPKSPEQLAWERAQGEVRAFAHGIQHVIDELDDAGIGEPPALPDDEAPTAAAGPGR